MKTILYSDATFDTEVQALLSLLRSGGLTSTSDGAVDVPAVVDGILADVQARGDQALIDFEAKFDKAELTTETLRVPAEQIAQAHQAAEGEFLDLIRRVIENIREYQSHIRIQAPPMMTRGGRRMGVRYSPIDRVGLYVPGGRALYPSTVLMTAVPAQVAGVKDIVMVSPPTTDGDIHPMVLALAGELGITEVYRVGGAQAVAALALGTETITPVQKIVGPGNAFVAEAKRRVFGRVGIDSIAGPSEVLIVADESAPARWVAADMLAQAEHDPGSAVLVTTSKTLADQVETEIASLLETLERADAIKAALERYSAVIVVENIDQACDIANDFATEHLQIMTKDNEATLAKIRNAGAIFVGPHTPVPLGDYYAGPSHVLPTGGGAKCFGPLSVNDFIKASSVVEYDAAAMAEDSDDVADFATREGLTAHAKAAAIRKNDEQ